MTFENPWRSQEEWGAVSFVAQSGSSQTKNQETMVRSSSQDFFFHFNPSCHCFKKAAELLTKVNFAGSIKLLICLDCFGVKMPSPS